MALSGKKRFREKSIQNPTKRQSLEAEFTRPSKQQNAGKKVVSLNELAWKEVTLPDRFDDAEGFFGLEEIEDVDVVRDTKGGNVEYRVASTLSQGGHSTPDSTNKLSTETRGIVDQSHGGEEWGGFDDQASAESTSQALSLNGGSDKEHKKQTKATPKNKIKSKILRDVYENRDIGASTSGNAFEILNDEDDSELDVSAWQLLGLSSETLSSLAKMRFPRPTPIQSAAIPEIMKGHDLIGKASTGSGKTLAFGIPILEHYLLTHLDEKRKVISSRIERYPPVAMILSPTRELAHQLSAHLADLCSGTNPVGPQIVTLTGGLSMQKQQRLLANADIIIGTPGRLWEVIRDGQGLLPWLKQVKFLVVDEADRLLSEGHFKEVEEILNSLDRAAEDAYDVEGQSSHISNGKDQRQTLVFSATFHKGLQRKLAGKGKNQGDDLMGKQESMEYLLKKLNFREEKPKLVDVNPVSQMAIGLKEGIVECAGLEKDLYLYALLLHHPNTRTLIFTNSIAAVRRLTPFLQNLNIPAHALHSQMPQKARLRSIERFSSPDHPGSILIATDVAARGLDIPSVHLVIHYHLPRAADMYVHRSGRTARAEKSGSSILLCAPEEVVGVRRLVAKVHARNTSLDDATSKKFFMRTIELDRRVVARLKPRVTLSKKISDASLAKEKKGHEDNWLRTAADDLGVDYDSEEFASQEAGAKGRGQGRRKAEKEARGLSKGEVAALRAELKGLLSQRINVGVSERYLSAGGVDVDELLREGSRGEFLGRVGGLGLD